MTIGPPNLVSLEKLPLRVSHPKHLTPAGADYFPDGAALSELGNKIGAESAIRAGTFEDAMLRALDGVSADQHQSSKLIQAAITDPESVDIHDITIAEAKASMSLNITRTLLSRLVQGWKDLINTR